MVYTLTFCPALEYTGTLNDISLGTDNMISGGALHVSGGGAVIAEIASKLSVPATVLGFAAGFTGGEIEGILRGNGVNTNLVYLKKGTSPFNMSLDHGEKLTRFVGQPLEISYNELMMLFSRLERLDNGDMLVLSGAVPPSVPADVYSFIPDNFAGKSVRLVLDIPAVPLAQCLALQPFLVITDRQRLGEIFGEPPQSEAEVIAYISSIRDMGAQSVLFLPGDDNTVILLDSSNNIIKRTLPLGTRFDDVVLNSLTAGFIVGCMDNDVDNEYSLMLAAASARAAAQKKSPSKSDIISIMQEMMKNA